jgi:hypothetical protein
MLCPIEQDKRWIKLLSFLKNRQKALFYWNMYKENIPDYFYSDPTIISQIPESSEEVPNPSEVVPIKPGVEELFDSTPELANQIYEALEFKTINESEITYTDDEGNPCAVNGLKGSKFKKGGKWEIIKEFKGKSHAQGGIDIEIGKGGIKMSNKQGKFEAKYGLIIPKNN